MAWKIIKIISFKLIYVNKKIRSINNYIVDKIKMLKINDILFYQFRID